MAHFITIGHVQSVRKRVDDLTDEEARAALAKDLDALEIAILTESGEHDFGTLPTDMRIGRMPHQLLGRICLDPRLNRTVG